MSNADVVETLRSLSGSTTVDKRHVAALVRQAVEQEIHPTAAELGAAAASWEQAATRWEQAGAHLASIGRGLPGTWTGTAATACHAALTGFTTAAAGPRRGAGDVAGALRRLDAALADARATRTAGRNALDDLMGANDDAEALSALPGIIQRLISGYAEADTVAGHAALWVRDAVGDLAFPARARGERVSPFLRAVSPSSSPKRAAGGGSSAKVAPAPRGGAARPKARAKVTPPAAKKPLVTAPAHRSPRSAPKAPAHRPAVKRPAATRHSTVRPNAVTPKASPRPITASGARAKVLEIARGYQGVPYVWGGTTPRGFDCSGLTQYVYRQVGINLPRLAEQQRYAGRVVPQSAAQPGDLVSMAHHVGIYVGGGMMLNAPHTGATVRTQRIWTSNYTVVRVLP